MKKIKFTIFVFAIMQNLNAQVGINTSSPTNTLHVKSNSGKDPVRIEGIQPGSGAFVVVDDNGVLKMTPDRTNLPFVLPAVSNTTGINLARGSETGSYTYAEGSPPNSSIMPGSGSWTKIPGLEVNFNIIHPKNTISMSVEGVVQYNGDMDQSSTVSFAIGIFVDNKLSAVRIHLLEGNGFSSEALKWEVLGQVSNLSVGSHKIEVYATRRNSSPNNNIYTPNEAISVAQPAPNVTNLNKFMTKGILQVSGVYN